MSYEPCSQFHSLMCSSLRFVFSPLFLNLIFDKPWQQWQSKSMVNNTLICLSTLHPHFIYDRIVYLEKLLCSTKVSCASSGFLKT